MLDVRIVFYCFSFLGRCALTEARHLIVSPFVACCAARSRNRRDEEPAAAEDKKDDFSTGPLSVLMQSVKNNTQVFLFL